MATLRLKRSCFPFSAISGRDLNGIQGFGIPRVLGHGRVDWLFIYLVLILVSCFLALFSCVVFCSVSSSNWCVQINVSLDPTALKFFTYYSLLFLCLSAPSYKKGFTPLPMALRFETFLVRRSTKTQKYNGVIPNNLRLFGPKPTFSCTHQFEGETELQTRQENKTQGSKQGK